MSGENRFEKLCWALMLPLSAWVIAQVVIGVAIH